MFLYVCLWESFHYFSRQLWVVKCIQQYEMFLYNCQTQKTVFSNALALTFVIIYVILLQWGECSLALQEIVHKWDSRCRRVWSFCRFHFQWEETGMSLVNLVHAILISLSLGLIMQHCYFKWIYHTTITFGCNSAWWMWVLCSHVISSIMFDVLLL